MVNAVTKIQIKLYYKGELLFFIICDGTKPIEDAVLLSIEMVRGATSWYFGTSKDAACGQHLCLELWRFICLFHFTFLFYYKLTVVLDIDARGEDCGILAHLLTCDRIDVGRVDCCGIHSINASSVVIYINDCDALCRE